jgi:hypothetical protein
MPNAADKRVVAEALLSARRLTEQLRLGQTPTRTDLDRVDALLRSALAEVDAPATT